MYHAPYHTVYGTVYGTLCVLFFHLYRRTFYFLSPLARP
jgi:hypothetical protein